MLATTPLPIHLLGVARRYAIASRNLTRHNEMGKGRMEELCHYWIDHASSSYRSLPRMSAYPLFFPPPCFSLAVSGSDPVRRADIRSGEERRGLTRCGPTTGTIRQPWSLDAATVEILVGTRGDFGIRIDMREEKPHHQRIGQ